MRTEVAAAEGGGGGLVTGVGETGVEDGGDEDVPLHAMANTSTNEGATRRNVNMSIPSVTSDMRDRRNLATAPIARLHPSGSFWESGSIWPEWATERGRCGR